MGSSQMSAKTLQVGLMVKAKAVKFMKRISVSLKSSGGGRQPTTTPRGIAAVAAKPDVQTAMSARIHHQIQPKHQHQSRRQRQLQYQQIQPQHQRQSRRQRQLQYQQIQHQRRSRRQGHTHQEGGGEGGDVLHNAVAGHTVASSGTWHKTAHRTSWANRTVHRQVSSHPPRR